MQQEQPVSLGQLRVNEFARIVGYLPGQPAFRQKLLAMGLTPGTLLMVKHVAPLGDPIEIYVRGYDLSLRKNEVKNIILERVHPCLLNT